jgi:hypothetical protein
VSLPNTAAIDGGMPVVVGAAAVAVGLMLRLRNRGAHQADANLTSTPDVTTG